MGQQMFERRISVGNWLTLLGLVVAVTGGWIRSKMTQAEMLARLSHLERQQEQQTQRLERAISLNVVAIDRNRDAVVATQMDAARTDARMANIEQTVSGNAEMLQELLGIWGRNNTYRTE